MIEEVAPNVRYAAINYGDDLRRIALRELGDASLWLDLVQLNRLRPPYVAEVASAGVLAYGDLIAIPSSVSTVSVDTDPAEVYGTDLLLKNRAISVDEGGDLAIVSGAANLRQALGLHIAVNKRELAFHPEFGCYVHALIGRGNGPTTGPLAAFYVKSALLEDARVASVEWCRASVVGDQIKVEAKAVPITGKPVDVGMVL